MVHAQHMLIVIVACVAISLIYTTRGQMEQWLMTSPMYHGELRSEQATPSSFSSDDTAMVNSEQHINKGTLRVCTQQERLQHMKRVCAARNLTNQKPYYKAVVDDKHQVFMCVMSKAGCTSFKALLLEANCYNFSQNVQSDSMMEVHHKYRLESVGLHFFSSLSEQQQHLALDTYFRFTVVRHPFERLLSVYRDKIQDPDSGFTWFYDVLYYFEPELFQGKKLKFFKQNAKQRDLADHIEKRKQFQEPTFLEFVTWLKETAKKDNHVISYQDICGFCAHDWDAIIHLETLHNDKEIIIKALDHDITYIPVRHSHKAEGRMELSFSSDIPEFTDVPDDVIDYFLDLYAVDMEMFGYKWNRDTNTASCQIETDNGVCC